MWRLSPGPNNAAGDPRRRSDPGRRHRRRRSTSTSSSTPSRPRSRRDCATSSRAAPRSTPTTPTRRSTRPSTPTRACAGSRRSSTPARESRTRSPKTTRCSARSWSSATARPPRSPSRKSRLTAMFRNLTAFSRRGFCRVRRARQGAGGDARHVARGQAARSRGSARRWKRWRICPTNQPRWQKDLAPMFAKLRPLLDNAEPTLDDLRYMLRKKGSANDAHRSAGQPARPDEDRTLRVSQLHARQCRRQIRSSISCAPTRPT